MKYRIRAVEDEQGKRFYPEFRYTGWKRIFFGFEWSCLDEFPGHTSYETFAQAQQALQEFFDEQTKILAPAPTEKIIPMEVFKGFIRQEFKGRD